MEMNIGAAREVMLASEEKYKKITHTHTTCFHLRSWRTISAKHGQMYESDVGVDLEAL